jgi:hypothetical protein
VAAYDAPDEVWTVGGKHTRYAISISMPGHQDGGATNGFDRTRDIRS